MLWQSQSLISQHHWDLKSTGLLPPPDQILELDQGSAYATYWEALPSYLNQGFSTQEVWTDCS